MTLSQSLTLQFEFVDITVHVSFFRFRPDTYLGKLGPKSKIDFLKAEIQYLD